MKKVAWVVEVVGKVAGWMSSKCKEGKVMSFKEFMAMWDEMDAWYFDGLTEAAFNADPQRYIDAYYGDRTGVQSNEEYLEDIEAMDLDEDGEYRSHQCLDVSENFDDDELPF